MKQLAASELSEVFLLFRGTLTSPLQAVKMTWTGDKGLRVSSLRSPWLLVFFQRQVTLRLLREDIKENGLQGNRLSSRIT